MSAREDGVATKVARKRELFRSAVARLSERAQSSELVRMLLLPGAFALVVGFFFMFFGWYGAAHSARQIEQVPYLISGGFIGLGLVFVGGLLLASALWMSMLQRFSEDADERSERRARESEERLRNELVPSRRPSNGRVRTARRTPRSARRR